MTRPASVGARAVLFGVGRMGQAMARGWLDDCKAAGLDSVILIEPATTDAVEALGRRPGAALNPAGPVAADILVMAVKPQAFAAAAGQAAQWAGPKTLVVSVMAGITLDRLEKAFAGSRCVRTMPNTPGAIGQGVTAFSLGASCRKEDAAAVRRLLTPLGRVEGPLPETQIDAVTAVSGSGPAYAFLLVEAMAAAGRKLGLPEDLSMRLAQQTVVGAGALLAEEGASAEALRKAVTSPGGTTQAALDVLMGEHGMPDLLRRAAEAACERSAALSRED